jgi:hypothetical protein
LVASCLGTDLKQVFGGKVEGRIEVTGIWWRRRKQLLDDLCKLQEKALDLTLWWTRSGRVYGPVVRHNRFIEWTYSPNFILLNNQRDAALSSCIYSSLQGYSTCFGCFLHPSSGVQLNCRCNHRYSSCVGVV